MRSDLPSSRVTFLRRRRCHHLIFNLFRHSVHLASHHEGRIPVLILSVDLKPIVEGLLKALQSPVAHLAKYRLHVGGSRGVPSIDVSASLTFCRNLPNWKERTKGTGGVVPSPTLRCGIGQFTCPVVAMEVHQRENVSLCGQCASFVCELSFAILSLDITAVRLEDVGQHT